MSPPRRRRLDRPPTPLSTHAGRRIQRSASPTPPSNDRPRRSAPVYPRSPSNSTASPADTAITRPADHAEPAPIHHTRRRIRRPTPPPHNRPTTPNPLPPPTPAVEFGGQPRHHTTGRPHRTRSRPPLLAAEFGGLPCPGRLFSPGTRACWLPRAQRRQAGDAACYCWYRPTWCTRAAPTSTSP